MGLATTFDRNEFGEEQLQLFLNVNELEQQLQRELADSGMNRWWWLF